MLVNRGKHKSDSTRFVCGPPADFDIFIDNQYLQGELRTFLEKSSEFAKTHRGHRLEQKKSSFKVVNSAK